MVSANPNAIPAPRRSSGWRSVFGSWEFGLLLFMAALYLIGVWVNPRFFGDAGALASILRDASRFGVIAVGMTFVIVNKDLDLSVGSTVALTSAVFSLMFAPNFMDLGPWVSLAGALGVGVTIGLVNGVLVTYLRVPAFIATLTMLFIGRGMVLGLTKGRNIGYADKASDHGLFILGDTNALGFSNHIIIFAVLAVLGGIVLAKTRWGYETYATGGNIRAAGYAGINTHWVRIRGFLLSSLCATMAGLMVVTQSKGITSQDGFGAELIVIASVIVGGASILGGRGRVFGSVLGATLVVLIDKVLREGIPTTRLVKIGDQMIEVQAMAQMPPGAVPAFLGLILLAAVLIEPWVIRRQLVGRLVARLRARPPPVVAAETVAIESAGTGGSTLAASELHARGLRKLLTYRETMAIGFVIVLWLVGMWLRPDFWGSLDNSFNLLLAFTEIGLMAHRGHHRLPGGHPGRHVQRLPGDQGPLARLRRHPGHVLHGPGHRRLAGRRPPAQPVPGELQPPGPQAHRAAQSLGPGAGAGQPAGPGRFRHEHPNPDSLRPGCDLRPGVVAHALRLHGQGHRRQPAGSRLCRHQHRPGPVPQSGVLRHDGVPGGSGEHRVLPVVQSPSRDPARTGRDRLGDYRRRQHLRRLRLGAGCPGRGRGDHPGPRTLVVAGIPARRPFLRHAAELGERLHRVYPDQRRAGRHLAQTGTAVVADQEPTVPRTESLRGKCHE
jgi:ribose/xylose/arabinose/galactoside ABC-type transport system permease subunit